MKKPSKPETIRGKPHKPVWEYDGVGGNEWYAMNNADGLCDILEKKKNANALSHDVMLSPTCRRHYDLKNMIQCRQLLVDGNEWRTETRLVRLRRIYRLVSSQQEVKNAKVVKKKPASSMVVKKKPASSKKRRS